MVIRTIEACARKALNEPSKQRFVTDVHAERYLWLLSVTPERPFADKQANHETALEVRKRAHLPVVANSCFTVITNVKQSTNGKDAGPKASRTYVVLRGRRRAKICSREGGPELHDGPLP